LRLLSRLTELVAKLHGVIALLAYLPFAQTQKAPEGAFCKQVTD